MNKLIGSAILSSMLISGIATADNVNSQLETDMMYGHKYTQQNSAMRSKRSQAGTGGHSDPKGLETDAIHQMTEHMEAMHADPSTAPDVRHGDNSETATDIMYHDNVKHTGS
jgi:hypothetical protein